MKTLLIAAAVLAAASSIPAQDLSEIKIERVASGYRFTEGPAWSRDGFLLFCDVPNDRIHQLGAGKPAAIYREPSGGADGNTFDAQGRLYTCEGRARRVTRTDKKGKVEILAEKWEGKRLNSPNDITVRRDGHVYFTDPAWGAQLDTRELDFWGVYHITPKGEMQLVAKPQGRPNGIALSPNGRILYVANSDERNIRAYDLDRNGTASNERVLVSGIEGVPDGLRLDEKGNLWVAAKQLFLYAPDGKQTGAIQLAETPSNCAFGDPDLETLYVTARTSVYRIRVGVKGSLQY